jgi:photosystem I subunit 11
MANFIKPYNDDPFVGHLATPITSSAVTRAILQNLPAYRFGLTPLLRGLEIGLAHGYFLIGPFAKLGPLRDSDIALLAGFMSTIGLIVILTLGLTIYGVAAFGQEKSSGNPNDLQTKKLGMNSKVVSLLVHVEVLDLHLFVYLVFQLLQYKIFIQTY